MEIEHINPRGIKHGLIRNKKYKKVPKDKHEHSYLKRHKISKKLLISFSKGIIGPKNYGHYLM